MTNDAKLHVLGKETMRKLRDDELDFVTGGRGAAVHHELVIIKVLDKASPQLFDAG
jgi:type VI protein secretion system component Hcp